MLLPLDRFVNAIYAWCLRRIAPDDLDKWLFQLNEPFPNQRPTEMTVEAEMDQFAAFAGAFGVRPPANG